MAVKGLMLAGPKTYTTSFWYFEKTTQDSFDVWREKKNFGSGKVCVWFSVHVSVAIVTRIIIQIVFK